MNTRDTLKNIWHPFTQMKTASPPIYITHATNCTLFAADGKTYIDAIASWWVNIHGHCNKKIAAAIAKQATILEHVIFAGFTHTPAINVAQNLINILPQSFSKIFFSDDGSTSVEVALKMAIQYWSNKGFTNKTTIIAFENAYHGDTFGAMSIAERNAFSAAFNPFLFDVKRIPIPTNKNISSVKKQLKTWVAEGNVAAFVFEPLVQGAAGMHMYTAAHLDTLIAIAKKQKVLCIADEVMTGFGRTGKNFAIEYLQHTPDIVCLSKGITGGFMALGVTACTPQIFDAFYANETAKTFFHGHSYTANPLACAAANASIALLVQASCQQKIKYIVQQHQLFAAKINTHVYVKNVRQCGTILAIELNTKEESSYFNSVKDIVYNYFLNKGIILRPLGNIIYIMPPYCIKKSELNKIYAAIADGLDYFYAHIL